MRFKYDTDKLVDILEAFAKEHNIICAEDIYQKDDVYTMLDTLVSDLYTKAATRNVMMREEYEEKVAIQEECNSCNSECMYNKEGVDYECDYHSDVSWNSMHCSAVENGLPPCEWQLGDVEVID